MRGPQRGTRSANHACGRLDIAYGSCCRELETFRPTFLFGSYCIWQAIDVPAFFNMIHRTRIDGGVCPAGMKGGAHLARVDARLQFGHGSDFGQRYAQVTIVVERLDDGTHERPVPVGQRKQVRLAAQLLTEPYVCDPHVDRAARRIAAAAKHRRGCRLRTVSSCRDARPSSRLNRLHQADRAVPNRPAAGRKHQPRQDYPRSEIVRTAAHPFPGKDCDP